MRDFFRMAHVRFVENILKDGGYIALRLFSLFVFNHVFGGIFDRRDLFHRLEHAPREQSRRYREKEEEDKPHGEKGKEKKYRYGKEERADEHKSRPPEKQHPPDPRPSDGEKAEKKEKIRRAERDKSRCHSTEARDEYRVGKEGEERDRERYRRDGAHVFLRQ